LIYIILILLPSLFDNYIYIYSRESGFDPNLIKAIIYVESRFHPESYNRETKCVGLMGIQSNGTDGDIAKLKNPKTNIKLGCMILKHKIKRAGSLYGGLIRYGGSARYSKEVLRIYEIIKEQKAKPTTKVMPKNKIE